MTEFVQFLGRDGYLPVAVLGSLPRIPNEGSNAFAALRAMMRGEGITAVQFFRLCGSLYLPSVIRDLRNSGWNIVDEWIHEPTNKRPGRLVKRYALRSRLIVAHAKVTG